MTETKKKICIVDDDKFLREMYTLKFNTAGFEVESFNGAEEVLTKFEAGYTPDILLFDIIMPVIDGWGLMKNITEKGYISSAKKIVLSNQGEQADISKAEMYKVDGYIVKALKTPSEVVEEVKKISSK
jgi:CheY-like chemotaxis protein